MPRTNGSYIGIDANPTSSQASGIWSVRDAERLLRSDKWPSQPGVPGAPSASAGDGQVSLSWAALTTSPAITDYGIQYSSNSGTTWTTFSDGVGTTTSATVTGLTNGTSYIFRLYGINALGDGPFGSASAPVTAGADADFASVAALLKFDGSSVVDLSPAARTVSVRGDASLSTTQSKFGGKSLYCDGSGDGVTIAHETSNGFSASDGDWTIEMWAYPTEEENGHLVIVSSTDLSAVGYQARLTSSGTIESNNAAAAAFNGGSYTINEWQHFAFVRLNGTITIYRNGVSQGGTSQTPGGAGDAIAFGYSAPNFGNFFFKGYLDDIRYTRGVARYASNFTPPESLPAA